MFNSDFSRDKLKHRRVVIISVRQHIFLIYNVIHNYVILASPQHSHTYKQKIQTHKTYLPARILGEVEYETKTKLNLEQSNYTNKFNKKNYNKNANHVISKKKKKKKN